MPLIELLTLNLGAAALKATAKLWFKKAPFAESLAGGVVDALKKGIEDFETRRATERLFTDLQDEVARRLASLIDLEFSRLPENEREAAVLAVADVLNGVSLERDMLEADLDATRLEAAARPQVSKRFATLGTDSGALAELLLRESCNYVVTLAGNLPNFQVAATREILKRHRELLADLNKVLDDLAAMRTAASGADMREAQTFELQYRRTLVRRLDRLELFGVRIIGAGAREYGLSVAYVTLTATGGRSPGPNHIDDVLAGASRSVIRGEAGSGKTTLLQWLAVRAASRDFSGPLAAWNERIPFYIRLRDYTEQELPTPTHFLDSTARNLVELMPTGWCQHVLADRALLLIDGIDELPASRRGSFHPWLRGVLSDFPNAVCIVNSRPAALDAEQPTSLAKRLVASHFRSLTLEPMTLKDSEALVAQWHAAVAKDLLDEGERGKLTLYERDLRQALRDRPAIRNLAANPLLCSMICALNWDRRQRLPDLRMELYRLALEMLLETRDEERGVAAARLKKLDRAAKEELLDTLAYWMLRNGYSEAKRESALGQIERALPRLGRIEATAAEILQELLERSGVLRQPQHGTVDFIHRTFLEYMAARAAVTASDFGVLVEQAKEESWRETIVFAGGHAKGRARDQLVEDLLKKPWLSWRGRLLEADVTVACCLETVADSLDPELLGRLKELARRLFPPGDLAAAQLLAPAAALEPDLLEGHAAKGAGTVAACIRTAAIVGGARMLEVIAGYAAVPGEEVDLELARAWDGFDENAFTERVIRRRDSLFGMTTSQLDDEAMTCLRLLVALGQHRGSPADLVARMREFQAECELQIAYQAGPPPEATDTISWSPWRFREGKRPPEKIGDTVIRSADGDRLRRLRSLRKLVLPSTEALVVPMLADLGELKELKLHLRQPTDIEPLARLSKLEKIELQGPGLRDARPLARCPLLTELSLEGCRIEDPSLIPFVPSLRSIILRFLPVHTLDGIEAATGLQVLVLASLEAPTGEWLGQLRELRTLEITYPEGEVHVPFASLAELEKLWLQAVPVSALVGLDMAPRLREVVLSNIPVHGPVGERLPASLEELTVFHTDIDLTHIGRMSRLRHLYINGAPVVQGGDHLVNAPALTYVRFEGCGRHDLSSSMMRYLGEDSTLPVGGPHGIADKIMLSQGASTFGSRPWPSRTRPRSGSTLAASTGIAFWTEPVDPAAPAVPCGSFSVSCTGTAGGGTGA